MSLPPSSSLLLSLSESCFCLYTLEQLLTGLLLPGIFLLALTVYGSKGEQIVTRAIVLSSNNYSKETVYDNR